MPQELQQTVKTVTGNGWVTLGSNPRIDREGGPFRFKAGKTFQS
jgi:hypothetical protein